MILLSFRNCAIGSSISIFKGSKVVAALETDLDIVDAVYVPKLDCKYKILIQHVDYYDFEIEWNPMLDGINIFVTQEKLLSYVVGFDLANTVTTSTNTTVLVNSDGKWLIKQWESDVTELTDEDFYKFQVDDLVNTKDGREGTILRFNEHYDFGTFYTLKMHDDESILEVHHEDDLSAKELKLEETNTRYGIWKSKRLMIEDFIFCGFMIAMAAAIFSMIYYHILSHK